MKVIYEELTLRIRSEINDLDRIVHRALRAWAQARKAQTDQDIYLDSTALNLHGFYSGIERLFELIARAYRPIYSSRGSLASRLALSNVP